MPLAEWVVVIVQRFGYAGVALLVALENLLPPIPSEVVLPMAGFAVARGALAFWPVVLWATVGAVAGALVLYEIGRRVGRVRVQRFVDRRGRWLLLSTRDVARADAWFARHGHWAVLFGRLAPGVRSLVSLPAGLAHMPLWKFALLTAVGSAAWNALLVGLGYELGAQWERISGYVDAAGTLVWVLLGALVLVFVGRRMVARGRDSYRS